MASWQLVAGTPSHYPEVLLSTARDVTVTWRLADPSTLTFALDGRHEQAGYVYELATDVHLLRDGVPVYTGRVGGTRDEIVDDVHTVSYETADTRALLGRRLWHGIHLRTHYMEQTTVVQQLLANTQGRPGGDLGIDTSHLTATGTYAVDRTVVEGSAILDELQAFAQGGTAEPYATPGFEWDITAGWTGRQLDMWVPSRGADRGVVLDYTFVPGRPRSSIVARVTRQLDPATYASSVIVSGGVRVITTSQVVTDPDTGESSTVDVEIRIPTVPVTVSAADIASRPEGLWERANSYPDLVVQDGLYDRAGRDLADLESVTPAYEVTLRRGAWDGPEHIWIGDTVRLFMSSGRLAEDLHLRVQEVKLTLGPDGQEDVTLTLGTPVGSLLDDLRRMERRVALTELH